MRRRFSRIAVRLLLFNVLVVFLPAAGVFSLHTLESQLLEMQERSMVQQGRLVAAALSGAAPNGDAAPQLLRQLGGRSESRIRIVDRTGRITADSATSLPFVAPSPAYDVSRGVTSRRSFLYRVGATLWRPVDLLVQVLRSNRVPTRSSSGDAIPSIVVKRALAGQYGATVRESSGQRSLTMYSALPLRGAGGEVTGAVLVSQSTSRILRALWLFRLDLFKVVVGSLFVAIALSLLLAATIARPLIQLRNEADSLLDPRGRLRGTFRGSERHDEIGDLTRALATLTARLERHIAFVEGFSADVSHEFKNPLASIRSAAELLAATTDDRERDELCATIDREVARLNRLLGGVREVSRIDAVIDREAVEQVDVTKLLAETAAARNGGGRVDVSVPREPLFVRGSADRLQQALSNVIDNAASFTPESGSVRVALRSEGARVIVTVDDDGPGIPPEHIERIFDRFFSFRPESSRGLHDGLGLSITKAIIESYGGQITAANRMPKGTRIEISLPRVGR